MVELNLQKANIKFSSEIISLLEDLYTELGEEAESIKFLNKKLIEEILASGKTEIYFIQIAEKKNIGIVTLTETQAIYAGGKYGCLDEMFVLPEHRSANIGEKVIKMIKHIAKEKNWKRVDVTAPSESKWNRTVSFYEKCGFVFTGPKLKFKI
ncbi:MAG: GNAT family N-acetyltransferase [Bacteroidia bacterium]|nr:GNAT family N-acetyltransferase [Bacteroidia bacterium]